MPLCNPKTENPLVSFVLLAYNQEKYIADAIKGALSQDYENLEIILSDDASTDSTAEIISSMVSEYGGQHEIVTNINPLNLGLASHFNKIMNIARGEIIVIAAGDDISLPARVTRSVDILLANPEAAFVSFTDILIDEHGKYLREGIDKTRETGKVTLEDYILKSQKGFSGASRAFFRELYDLYGPLDSNCPTEDTPLLIRGLITGEGVISPENTIKYRKHPNNLSNFTSIAKMDLDRIRTQHLQDIECAIAKNLLDTQLAEKTKQWVNEAYEKKLTKQRIHKSRLFSISFFCFLTDKRFSAKERKRVVRKKIYSFFKH